MIKELLKGRFLRHPVHPMLVHFPTALFLFSFILDVMGIMENDPALFRASLYSMMLGLGGGVLAAVFGLIDYLKIAGQPERFRKASIHAVIQFVVLMIFGVIAGLRITEYPVMVEPGMTQLVITGFAVCAMLAGNFFGGDLVYRDGVGVHNR